MQARMSKVTVLENRSKAGTKKMKKSPPQHDYDKWVEMRKKIRQEDVKR